MKVQSTLACMSVEAQAQDGLFGRLAVHRRLITIEQLQEATAHQQQDSAGRSLAEVLLELGFLSPEGYDDIFSRARDVLDRRGKDESEREAEREALAAGAAEAVVLPRILHPVAESMKASLDFSEDTEDVDLDWVNQNDPAVVASQARAWLISVLSAAVARQASDIHVHAGARVVIRRFGQLIAVSDELPPEFTSMALMALLPDAERARLLRSGHIDYAFSIPSVARFRANIYRQVNGTDGVFRAIKIRPPSLAELSLPPALAELTTFHQGLVLCTGPSACGKSSTLAALVHMINEERAEHIVTVEDPIEVLHPSIRCVVNQRQPGRHTKSFSRALRAALREDPDVIVIGEMRDRETTQLALTAAETGHLVFATIHTNSAVRTINRVIGEFSPEQQPAIRTIMAESLRAIVSQRLLPRKDGSGVVPAVEVLMSTPAVANMIRDSRVHQIRASMQTGAALGMQTLDAALQELVSRGAVDETVARSHADDPRAIVGVTAFSAPRAQSLSKSSST